MIWVESCIMESSWLYHWKELPQTHSLPKAVHHLASYRAWFISCLKIWMYCAWIYCKSCFWTYIIEYFKSDIPGYSILLIVTFWSPPDKNKNLLKLVPIIQVFPGSTMLGTLCKNTLTKNTSLSIFSNWSILRKSLLCHLLPSLPPQTNVLDNSKKIFFWQLFTIFGSPWNLGRKKLKAVGHSFQKIYHVPWSTGALWRSRDTAHLVI